MKLMVHLVMDGITWKPNVEMSPACPRCGSCNTKFCYYNNYSLTQPRYFCKGCRRYWTKGGSLRNVPVGGGCRKSRRGKSTRLSPAAAATIGAHHHYQVSVDRIIATGHDTATTRLPTGSTEGPTIDLALVYANFLNQKPERESRIEVSEAPTSAVDMQMNFSTNHFLLEDDHHVECHPSLLDTSHLHGFDSKSIHKQQEETLDLDLQSSHTPNNDHSDWLPPPSEGQLASISQEMAAMAWSNSPLMLAEPLLPTAGIQPEAQLPGHFTGTDHGSPFDLSSYGAFFTP